MLCVLSAAVLAEASLNGRTYVAASVPVNRQKVAAASEKIDPNLASAASLRRLHPLGPVRVQALVDYRAAHGPRAFSTAADLAKVYGIGPATVDRLREYLSLP